MLVAYLGFILILQASFIAGRGNQVYNLPGGGQVILITPGQDSNSKPEHKHKEKYPDGVQVIQLGDDSGHHHHDHHDKDWNSNLPDEIWDYLKLQNITKSQVGVQFFQLGGDYGPKRRHSHDDDDDDDNDNNDSLRGIFKLFRFSSRRGNHRSNSQFLNLQGRDLDYRQPLAQDRSDYKQPGAASQADVPRTRVKIIRQNVRQNVPRRMMVRNLRTSQAHLTNMQTLSFPVFEEEWQMT